MDIIQKLSEEFNLDKDKLEKTIALIENRPQGIEISIRVVLKYLNLVTRLEKKHRQDREKDCYF